MGVIQAYFDESGREGDCKYALFAGAVGTPEAWSAFSAEWNASLADKGVRALHMVDAMNYKGYFRGWESRQDERDQLLARLAFIFENHIEQRVISPHEVQVFRSLPDKQQRGFRKLHYVLFEACIKGLLQVADLKANDVLHLFFDSSEEHSIDCLKLYLKMRKQDPLLKSKCALLAFGEDELTPPLQAVDMLAYCEYRYLAAEGRPAPLLELFRSILHGAEGRQANVNYDIRTEEAELGSGEASRIE